MTPQTFSNILLGQISQLVAQVVQLSGPADLIYANTPKAFVIGAIASLISGRPIIYHLRDILFSL